MALVEIGTLEEPAFTTRPVIDDDSRAELRRAGAVGEMCGRFFGARGGECQTSHRARVIGIDLETLRSCPEVVAVISGATPRAAVLAAIAGGLVRSLVIDEHGAAALLICSSELGRNRRTLFQASTRSRPAARYPSLHVPGSGLHRCHDSSISCGCSRDDHTRWNIRRLHRWSFGTVDVVVSALDG